MKTDYERLKAAEAKPRREPYRNPKKQGDCFHPHCWNRATWCVPTGVAHRTSDRPLYFCRACLEAFLEMEQKDHGEYGREIVQRQVTRVGLPPEVLTKGPQALRMAAYVFLAARFQGANVDDAAKVCREAHQAWMRGGAQ
jgi:hypothetical protein